MPSPFPGMDPYLEKRSFWPSVHTAMIAYIAEMLQPMIRPKYVARIEERIQLASDSSREFIPDAMLVQTGVRESTVTYATNSETVVADEPIVATLLSDERKVRFVEIIEAASGDVVTVIELLSPANKRADGREKYLSKQENIVQSTANLVEIDLLSYGQATVLARHASKIRPDDWRYIVSVSRAASRHQFEYYAFTLKDRLPRCKIPLRDPDPDVVLDLPAIFNRCYDAGAYDLLVDYKKLPEEILLNEREALWVNELFGKPES